MTDGIYGTPGGRKLQTTVVPWRALDNLAQHDWLPVEHERAIMHGPDDADGINAAWGLE